METLAAGPEGVFTPGTVRDVDEAEGAALVGGGYATVVVTPVKADAASPAGDPPAGDPPAGDPPAGDPPAGDPPAAGKSKGKTK
jgi:hypothetical protein